MEIENQWVGTGFIDFDGAVIGDLLEQAEEGDLVRSKAWEGLVGSNVLDQNRGAGKRCEYQSLP